MTGRTGYEIREGSVLLAERLTGFGGFGVFDQLEECYAIRDTEAEAAHASHESELYLNEAARCGHPLAERWVGDRLPLTIRTLTIREREEALEGGTPLLDREP